MLLTNQAYNILKWIAQYFLPASGTLYFALAAIWGLPYGEQIIGTLTALNIFLGVILGISTQQYKANLGGTNGSLVIDSSGDKPEVYLSMDPDTALTLENKDTITLKVNKM